MEDDERLQVALAAANNIGTWDWDVVSGLVKADARVCEFYGVDPKLGADGAPATEFERRIHPDDLQMFHTTIIAALREGAPFTADYRVLQPDGSARWVSAQGRCTQDQDNKTFRCEGVALDITSRKLLDSALRESEQRFRLIAENAPVMLWMGDRAGKCMYLNRAQREFWGVTEERVGAFDWNDTLHPEDREVLFTPFARAMQEHASFQVEARFRRAADGAYRIINTQAHPRFGPFGDFLGMIGVNVDVTETRQAVVALRAETRRLEILNRTGAAVAAEVSIEKIVQIIVEACTELTGAQFGAFFYNVIDDKGESYMLYALAGAPREAFSKFPMPRATAVFRPTYKGEGIIRSDDILKDPRYGLSEPYRGMPPGHLPVRSYLAVPVVSRAGEVLGGLFFGHGNPGVFRQEHETLLVGIAGQAAVAIDRSRLFQAAERELQERQRAERALQALNASLETQVAERTAELRATAHRLRTTIETSYIYQAYITRDGTLLDANAASLAGIGAKLEDVAGKPFWDTPWFTGTPGMPEAIRQAVALAGAGQTVRQSATLKLPSGERSLDLSLRPVKNERGEVTAIVPEATDTTERVKAEEALRQAQKMETIGQLTGGIAHDFNNMLAVIIGGLNMLQRRLARGDTDVQKYLDAAMDGATRAASLTQRLLAFSRQQPLTPQPINASAMVNGMTELLGRTLADDVSVKTVLAETLWQTYADALQLETSILNLAVNARDAMPSGGTLTIETRNIDIGEVEAAAYEIAAGQYVLIAVTDTGTGMSPDVASRAFDPFFTTKSIGKGTGLGLSQVFGFIRQSGGHVKIESEIGVGTTVKIFLPRYTGDAKASAPRRPASPARRGEATEIVLVVEDDDRVRSYSSEALRELGYAVIDAASGADALHIIDGGQKVTLLFTDIVMPEMNGQQLAELAVKRLPTLKVLFTTGYTRDAMTHGVLNSAANVLQKPFGIEQLATKVRGILDG